MNYEVYTDGSHFKNGGSGRLGVGAVLVDPSRDVVLNKLSESVDKFYFREHYGTEDFSNPTMEIYAVYRILSEWKDTFKPSDSIVLYADYMGVSSWLTGKWKINKSYIRIIVNDIISLIRKYNINIEFKWVKGHYGEKYNEMADQLAKGKLI